jgi:hypothetical protein
MTATMIALAFTASAAAIGFTIATIHLLGNALERATSGRN